MRLPKKVNATPRQTSPGSCRKGNGVCNIYCDKNGNILNFWGNQPKLRWTSSVESRCRRAAVPLVVLLRPRTEALPGSCKDLQMIKAPITRLLLNPDTNKPPALAELIANLFFTPYAKRIPRSASLLLQRYVVGQCLSRKSVGWKH